MFHSLFFWNHNNILLEVYKRLIMQKRFLTSPGRQLGSFGIIAPIMEPVTVQQSSENWVCPLVGPYLLILYSEIKNLMHRLRIWMYDATLCDRDISIRILNQPASLSRYHAHTHLSQPACKPWLYKQEARGKRPERLLRQYISIMRLSMRILRGGGGRSPKILINDAFFPPENLTR